VKGCPPSDGMWVAALVFACLAAAAGGLAAVRETVTEDGPRRLLTVAVRVLGLGAAGCGVAFVAAVLFGP
jgi:hypothetical protein